MAKKYIGHILKPYSNIIPISYIPCWIDVEGMQHMTEGGGGVMVLLAPRGPDEVLILYTRTS
jgi:hypothetical protein